MTLLTLVLLLAFVIPSPQSMNSQNIRVTLLAVVLFLAFVIPKYEESVLTLAEQ
jgi:hypothetical protein